jgi:hypothetical protein
MLLNPKFLIRLIVSIDEVLGLGNYMLVLVIMLQHFM